MHKGVILLMKSENEDPITDSEVELFMEPYESHVWDWYEIGGRWDGELNQGKDNNIVLLSKCVEVVKLWRLDRKIESSRIWEQMIKAREEELVNGGGTGTSGYLAGLYKNLDYGNFSFECNIYDAESQESEYIPDDLENYYAIMLDMHN